MAITITKQPGKISLAGNPILVSASSNLFVDKLFRKACIDVGVKVHIEGGTALETYTFPLSQPIVDGTVIFDISSCLRSVLSSIDIYRLGHEYAMPSVSYSFKVWDEYMDEDGNLVSTKDTAKKIDGFFAIPGSYTEVQRTKLSDNISKTFGQSCIMSNKPLSLEPYPVGIAPIIPIYSDSSEDAHVYVDGAQMQSIAIQRIKSKRVVSGYVNDSLFPISVGVHTVRIGDANPVERSYCVIPSQASQVCFDFVNRLGGIENVVCYSRVGRKDLLSMAKYVRYQGKAFRPEGGAFNRMLSRESVCTMSTGPLTREWAEWFMQDFFTSGRWWMKFEGEYIPVCVSLSDNTVLYTGDKAELIDIPFEVSFAMEGVPSVSPFGL